MLISPVFVLSAAALALAPGPDILFVVAKGISQGRKMAVVAATGFISGLSIHTTLAVCGLSALLLASTLAFACLKTAGAAYLIYLGVKAWRSSGLLSLPPPGEPGSNKRIFMQAFLMNVLNPKVAIFFLAFLPQFTRPEAGSLAVQFLVLGLGFAAVSWIVFVLAGIFSSWVGSWIQARPKLARTLDRIAGSIFIALGIRLFHFQNR